MDYEDPLYRKAEEDARPHMDNPMYASSNQDMMVRLMGQCGSLEGTHRIGTLDEIFPNLDREIE
ncbi:MAG: hypothetical protein KKD17_05100 [Nanoarchaeota archaeon]|nr:hypothetical protein [Nanoarchaeota archaeon]